jgi:hypothetical protein
MTRQVYIGTQTTFNGPLNTPLVSRVSDGHAIVIHAKAKGFTENNGAELRPKHKLTKAYN